MKPSNTSKRLQQIMSERNLRQTDIIELAAPFCEKYNIKVGKSDISQYVNGKTEPRQHKLTILSLALDVSEAWLMGYDVPRVRELSDIFIPIKKATIPVIGSMACGEPIYRENDFPIYVAVGNEIKADAAVVAQGDSMINARINDGDIVFIRYQPSVENGEIAAVWVDGDDVPGYQIKRFYRYDNMIILRSDSPDREEWVYKEEDAANIRIIGKAIAFQSDVK